MENNNGFAIRAFGMLVMFVGGFWSFFNVWTSYQREIMHDYFNIEDVIVQKSPAIALIVIGFVIYLIGKEIRNNQQ